MLSVQQFLTKKGMTPMAYTPYSPERLFFLLRMKKVVKGKHFAKVEEVKQKTAEALKDIKSMSSKLI